MNNRKRLIQNYSVNLCGLNHLVHHLVEKSIV